MQSCPAPRRRQARAALSLAAIAAALTAWLILPAPAQAEPRPGAITSSYVLRGPTDDSYLHVMPGPGGVYAVGATDGHNVDVLITRNTFANRNLGHFTWSNPAHASGPDLANAMTVDRAGNVVVVGDTLTNGYSDWDVMVLKVNPRLQLVWAAVLDGGAGLGDGAWDVACDRAGNVYVAGNRETAQGHDFWTMKLNAGDGAIVWQAFYDAGPGDGAHALCLDAHSNVYVTGSSDNTGAEMDAHGICDLVTIKYDRHGVQRWVTRTDSSAHGFDLARDIALGTSGALFVAGETRQMNGAYRQQLWLVRLTTDGRERWQRTLDGAPWNDEPVAFALGRNNSSSIAGNGTIIEGNSFTFRSVLARWDGAGRLLWARERLAPAGRVELRDLVVDDDGNAWCAGWQALAGSSGALVCKYDARGRELWTSVWDDPPNTYPMFASLTLVERGQVFAAGDSVAAVDDDDAALVAFRR